MSTQVDTSAPSMTYDQALRLTDEWLLDHLQFNHEYIGSSDEDIQAIGAGFAEWMAEHPGIRAALRTHLSDEYYKDKFHPDDLACYILECSPLISGAYREDPPGLHTVLFSRLTLH